MRRPWFLAVAGLTSVLWGEPPSVDWQKVQTETLGHYLRLIKTDTSNPPGNETKAVEYLRDVLAKEGIEAKVFAQDPQRANLVARLKGSGKARPVLIMGHTDVVGVQRERWSVDPFAGVQKDGYIYGRGTQDDKDNVTACLMTMILLKRHKVPLDRDVIFLAEAGEEGTSSVGIEYMIREHWPEIEAEFALAEGGIGAPVNGVVRMMEVATTEKVPRTTRLVAHGNAGHGSRPDTTNAIAHLAAAVAAVAAWQTPMRLNDTTRTYFERLATVSEPEAAARYNHLTDAQQTQTVQQYLQQHEPMSYSMLRTSIAPTMLKAGFRSNVIPSEAEATLDVRALPDENMEEFYASMQKVINDPAVEVMPMRTGGRPPGKPSRMDTAMFRALEKVQKGMYPQAVTLPRMSPGATDMAQLRMKGVDAYGIGPVVPAEDRGSKGAHGDDERLSEKSLHEFVQFTFRTVTEVAGAK